MTDAPMDTEIPHSNFNDSDLSSDEDSQEMPFSMGSHDLDDIQGTNTGLPKNLKRTDSLALPTFNTVRISCHGEFTIQNSLEISSKIDEIKGNSDYIQLHIFFRAEVGRCVLARESTIVTGTCSLEDKPNQSFGEHDFNKDMTIYVNKNNSNDYHIESIGSRSYDKFPNILFSFNIDYKKEGMYLGHSLYNTKDGLFFEAKNKCGFEQSVNLSPGQKTYSLELINKTGPNLIRNLLNLHSNDFTGLSEINLYISSCLYVRTKDIPYIEKNYRDWFQSHKNTIKEEYLNENSEIVGKYMTTMTNIESIEQELSKIKSETTDKSKLKNINIFISILQGTHKILDNYVEKYLDGNIDECPIDDLNNMIDILDVKGITNVKHIENNLIEQLQDEKLELELNEGLQPNSELEDKLNELKKELVNLKKELDEITNVLQRFSKCSSKPGIRSGVRNIDQQLLEMKNDNSNAIKRERDRRGGKKLKKTIKKKKGGKKKKITLKKGTLTKQAKSHGYKDVMKFARLTMRLHKKGKKTYPNGKRITKLLVKRSNFAVNFNKKK